jgi:hypothetical protein
VRLYAATGKGRCGRRATWRALLPAVRHVLPQLRRRFAALAAPGTLLDLDNAGCGGVARGVPQARGGAHRDALVGGRFPLHGALRAGGD